jgi:hypothetical protein
VAVYRTATVAPYVCVYCGGLGNTRDHVIPRCYLAVLRDCGLPRRQQIVRCCSRCNSLAGKRLFGSFEEKRAWIRSALGLSTDPATEEAPPLTVARPLPRRAAARGKPWRPRDVFQKHEDIFKALLDLGGRRMSSEIAAHLGMRYSTRTVGTSLPTLWWLGVVERHHAGGAARWEATVSEWPCEARACA